MGLCSESMINEAGRTRTFILETFSFYRCPPAPVCHRQSVHSFCAPVWEIKNRPTVKVFSFIFCDGASWRAASEACIPAACEGGEPGAEQMQRNSARLETRRRGAEARRRKSSSAPSLCISVTLGTRAREAGVKAPRGGGWGWWGCGDGGGVGGWGATSTPGRRGAR